jgi:hypothetical protein
VRRLLAWVEVGLVFLILGGLVGSAVVILWMIVEVLE